MDSTTDEDTNGSFEFVDRVTDSSESDEKHFEIINDKKETSSESSDKSNDFDEENNRNEHSSSQITDELHENGTSEGIQLVNEEKKEINVVGGEEWLDILGSGQLLKKVLKEGSENNRPQRLDICEIRYECKIGEKIVEKEQKLIQVGDTEVIQGLDITLPLMNVGEVSLIKIGPRFGYGAAGYLPNFPPNSSLLYEVELLSASPEAEIESMSVEIRSEIGKKKKDRGNWWYSRGDYVFAMQCYKRALEYLDYTEEDDLESKEEKTKADSLIEDRMKVYNNLGTVQMKVGDLDSALNSINTVLNLDPNNIKAIYRKGKILVEKNELSDALVYFNKALELDPENSSIRNEMQKSQKILNKQSFQERALYKRMFTKPIGSDKKPSSTSHSDCLIKIALVVGGLIALLSVGIYYSGYRLVQ